MLNYFSGEHYLVKLNGGNGIRSASFLSSNQLPVFPDRMKNFFLAAIISFIERPCICPQQR